MAELRGLGDVRHQPHTEVESVAALVRRRVHGEVRLYGNEIPLRGLLSLVGIIPTIFFHCHASVAVSIENLGKGFNELLGRRYTEL